MKVWKKLPHWAATTVVAMFIVAVGATAANALSCDNCVNSGDIVNGTIQRVDLSPSARSLIGTVLLAQANSIGNVNDTFDSFTVTVPAAGVLQVRVEGGLWLNNDSNAASSVTGSADVALCTAPDTVDVAACGNAFWNYYSQDADDTTSSNETNTFSLTRVMNVAAGAHTFYLNGRANNGELNLYGGPNVDGAQAIATFHHGTLSVTS